MLLFKGIFTAILLAIPSLSLPFDVHSSDHTNSNRLTARVAMPEPVQPVTRRQPALEYRELSRIARDVIHLYERRHAEAESNVYADAAADAIAKARGKKDREASTLEHGKLPYLHNIPKGRGKGRESISDRKWR